MDVEIVKKTPACTDCARRKIKCDRNVPCSNCTSAKIDCHYSQKVVEKKSRVSLTRRYEASLSGISHQLDDFSGILQHLVRKVDGLSQRNGSADDSQREIVPTNDSTSWDRDSSARGLVDRRLDTTQSLDGLTDTPEDAIEIVETLKTDTKIADSVSFADRHDVKHAGSFSLYPELGRLPMPMATLVLQILNLPDYRDQRYFIENPHMSTVAFAEYCQKVYFPAQTFTVFTWINVNCGIYYLLRDLESKHLSLQGDEKSQNMAICAKNIDAAVRNLKMCNEASFETAQALLGAALVSMQGGHGSVSWTLLSNVSRMVVDLGYHQLPTRKELSPQRTLFWHVYALNRSLAFTFNRSTGIHDHEITTTLPTPSEDFSSQWGATFLQYIKFSQFQYEIYENLLSARAKQLDSTVRFHRAQEYTTRLIAIRDQLVGDSGSEDASDVAISIGISAMLTIVCHTLPPDDQAEPSNPLRFHELAVDAGRATLQALLRQWQKVSQKDGMVAAEAFVKLPLLFMPFLPFIAVFGHQIATHDQDDLELLRQMVNIVQTVAEINGGMNKMHVAFLRLLRIAEAQNARARNGEGATGSNRLDATNSQSALPDGDQYVVPDINWDDKRIFDQDWDQSFDDFDFGLGADTAREIMPWFQQHVNDLDMLG